MALSDACFEFLETVASAADELARGVHHYSDPEYPVRYGAEIDALRRACAGVKEAPYDPEAGARLIRLAASVMAFLDAVPDTEQARMRMAATTQLIRILESELKGDEALAVSALIRNVVVDTSYTKKASERLKTILAKLGKPTYETAIKIISDIGSATAKKMLGL